MNISQADFKSDLPEVINVASKAFLDTPDSSLDEWFSFDEMQRNISLGRGLCLVAKNDSNKLVGVIYAEQESPINGRESLEKWVIILAGVDPSHKGEGIGSKLLNILETELRNKSILKLFVFTNSDDNQVINFYRNNGYEDAGYIKDYQYGKNNSAVFLLKYLN